MLPDNELIDLYKDTKDQSHVGELFERYRHLVLGGCFKILKHRQEAEDATMEIFEKLIVKLLEHKVERFSSWLHTVTRNHCNEKHRRNKGLTHVDVQDKKFESAFMEKPEHEHLDDDTERSESEVREAIGLLKPDQKKVIELFFYEDKSYKEISEILGIDAKKVKSDLQNAKRNLEITLRKKRAT